MKMKVMGLNPVYFLKYLLLYIEIEFLPTLSKVSFLGLFRFLNFCFLPSKICESYKMLDWPFFTHFSPRPNVSNLFLLVACHRTTPFSSDSMTFDFYFDGDGFFYGQVFSMKLTESFDSDCKSWVKLNKKKIICDFLTPQGPL